MESYKQMPSQPNEATCRLARCLTRIIFVLLSLAPSSFAEEPQSIDTSVQTPRLEVSQVFETGRFPNVVVTQKGTVLATFGATKLVVKRSEDGGKTWSDTIQIARQGIHGGGTTVDETTGHILTFAEEKHPPAPLTIYRSKDDGKTWTAVNFEVQPDRRGKVPSMHMNEHGITLLRGDHRGRLIRPSRSYGKGNRPESLFPTHYTNAIYSDDGGSTWQPSEPFSEYGTGEAAIVELSDGRLYYNTRRHWAPKNKTSLRRWHAWSTDGGKSWTDVSVCKALPDGPQDTTYGCMGGLVRLPIEGQDILVYSNCDSIKGRRRGTVWASFDGAKTWPIKRLVHEGPFAYSSLATGRAGTSTDGWIYLHFESNGSKLARFNLRWILEGEPTGDGTIPDNLN